MWEVRTDDDETVASFGHVQQAIECADALNNGLLFDYEHTFVVKEVEDDPTNMGPTPPTLV